jgi:hypothetical protein
MVAEAVVDSEALISSIADEKAHQLGFRYWAYSAWAGEPRKRLWSRHNLPQDLWSAYLQMLCSSTHGLPMRWDIDRPSDAAIHDTAPQDRLLDLLHRHDIGCGLQLPLYAAGELAATLVLASTGALSNRARQVVFQQGLAMLAELHALCTQPSWVAQPLAPGRGAAPPEARPDVPAVMAAGAALSALSPWPLTSSASA